MHDVIINVNKTSTYILDNNVLKFGSFDKSLVHNSKILNNLFKLVLVTLSIFNTETYTSKTISFVDILPPYCSNFSKYISGIM